MALPKAVQAIGDAAEAAAIESGMRGTPGAAPAAAPGAPAEASPAQAPLAAVPAPTDKATVDPGDWKERMARYKAGTDRTISDLRATLATSQQTVTALQSQVAALSAAKPAAEPEPPKNPELPADLSNDAKFKAWLARIPNARRLDYEDSFWETQYIIQMNSVAAQSNAPDTALQNRVNTLEQHQVLTDGQQYEKQMDVAYPDDAWIHMASGDDWQGFCAKQVSPVDTRTFGQLVKDGSNNHQAATVIWVLKQYEQYLLTLNAGAGSGEVDPLTGLLTPGGSAGDGGDPISQINAQAEIFTVTQVNEFFKDVATTKKYTAEEASSIETQIKAAQAAGKIIQG